MIQYKETTQCISCLSDNSKRKFKFLSKDNNWYTAMKCTNCGLVYATPQPVLTAESINEIYASDYYDNYFGTEISYQDPSLASYYMQCYEKEFAVYKQYTSQKEGLRVLDVGCGDGKFLEIFQKNGWQCLGLEPSETSRIVARNKGFEVIDNPFLEMPETYGQFDFIFMDNVIEHINEPNDFAKKAFDLLLPGGVFVTKTPNSNSLIEKSETIALQLLPSFMSNALMKGIKKYMGMGTGRVHRYGNLHPPVHLAIYNKSSITKLLEKAGFENKNIHVFRVSSNHPKWSAKMKTKGIRSFLKLIFDNTANSLNMGEFLITIAKK